MKQIPLPMGLEPVRSFSNFFPGANGSAIAHLTALAPGSAPVYLWGAAGGGKTHLLQALVTRFHALGASTACFCPADPTPWSHDDERGLIVFDDCDRLDPGQQHAAFALFAQAATAGIAVAAAGRVPPVDLPLREDLRSRLAWGTVFALQPLNEPETRAVLRREADRRGLFLSDEVIDHLLTRFARDLKHLMAMLDRMDHFSLSSKRAVTVPMLKLMLAEEQCE